LQHFPELETDAGLAWHQEGDFDTGSEAATSVFEFGAVLLASLEAVWKRKCSLEQQGPDGGSIDAISVAPADPMHLYIVFERQSGGSATREKSHAAATDLRQCFASYWKSDAETVALGKAGKVTGMWACPDSGGITTQAWCHKSGRPTRGAVPYKEKNLRGLTQGGKLEPMIGYMTRSLLDGYGKGGQAGIQTLGCLQDRTRPISYAHAESNGGGTPTEQCRKHTYVRIACQKTNTLASVLGDMISATQEMWGYDETNSVPVILSRRIDRSVNMESVASFLPTNVKFAFCGDSNCSGVASVEDHLRGSGRTMLEWVKTPGFLEQVCRNEQVRRDIRRAIAFWRL
jgi:hypothetical protein